MAFLNAMRDPMGIPFYPAVFQFLMVLTFALHIVMVNLVLGGTFLALWGRMRGDDLGINISKTFAKVSTIGTSLAIVLGVAPLLFVQVLYDPMWYTSSVMSAWWTMIFLISIALSFSFAYIFYLKENSSTFWCFLSLLFLIVAGVIIHSLSMEILHPDKWSSWIAEGGKVNFSGWILKGFSLPRFLHFIAPSFTAAGLFMMLCDWYRGEDTDYGKLGAKVAFYSVIAEIIIGIWFLLAQPFSLSRSAFLWISVVLAIILLVTLAKSQKNPSGYAILSSLLFLLTVLSMGALREVLRTKYLGKLGYSISTYKLNLSLGSTLLFLVTFVMGLIVVFYPVTVVYKMGKSEEKPAKLDGLKGYGKVAAALPVIWLIVVAALGIVISLKNGALF